MSHAHDKNDPALVYGQIACWLGVISGILGGIACWVAFGLLPNSDHGAWFRLLIVAIIAGPIFLVVNMSGIFLAVFGLLTRSSAAQAAVLPSLAALAVHPLPAAIVVSFLLGFHGLDLRLAVIVVAAHGTALAIVIWSHLSVAPEIHLEKSNEE